MTYGELVTEFHGRRVIDFQGDDFWEGPDLTYRLREEYEDEVKIADRLDSLLSQPGANQLTRLIIGAWSGACEGGDSTDIVAKLVDLSPQLPNLRALFFGEMTFEECEISWIQQTDLSPLLTAFPNLQVLRIRGGTGLTFSRVKHNALRELAIESGGLSQSTLRELFLCDFPQLEHLELLLGDEGYGFDGSPEDLQPLLSGKLYPKLKFLGLMNSEIANELAAVVVNSPIVSRLETLDLSMGNLTTEGVQSLHGLAAYKNLKQLNLTHHYASPEAIAALARAVPCNVIADEPQDPDDEWRPIVHAE